MKTWDMFIPKTHLGQSSEPIRLVHISVPISHAFPPPQSFASLVTPHSSPSIGHTSHSSSFGAACLRPPPIDCHFADAIYL